ncbi:hypothetical protein Tco_1054578, partial [Tanacetum coccineum]
ADYVVVTLPAADQALSVEETKSFETDESAATPPPHPAYHVTARISIPALVPTPVRSDAEVARLLAISTPPSSLLSPCITIPVSSPVPVLSPSPPASPIRPLGYRDAMIRLRGEAASTSHSLPLPPPIILSHTRPAAPSSRTPPLHLLSSDHREDIPEVTLPPRKRLGIALGLAYEVGESSSAAATRPAKGLKADYGFVATMDREIRRDPERDDTNEIYTRLDDEQSGRQLLAGRLNVLFRDMRAHARTARLMETEARMSRELQSADHRRQTVITKMLAADHRRQKQLIEVLKLIKRPSDQWLEFKEAARDQRTVMQHECVEATIQEKVARRTMRSHLEGYVNSGTFADRQTKNKRKPYNNQQPQQHYQNKRQNTDMAYAAGTVEKKPYGGSKPLCSKCNYHHDGPCALKCHKYNKVSHFARDCKSTTNANNANHQEGRTGSGQKPAFCFVCGAPGTFKTGNVKS